jgi:hypothetical protein
MTGSTGSPEYFEASFKAAQRSISSHARHTTLMPLGALLASYPSRNLAVWQ